MRSSQVGVLCAVILLSVVVTAVAQQEIWINRVEERGRLLVPLRGIFESFAATVEWNGARKMVTIYRGGDEIVMYVNDHSAYINGQECYLDVPPRLIRSQVHVPLRFVGEALGGTVDYHGSYVDIAVPGSGSLVVYIRSTGGPPPSSTEIAPFTRTRRVHDSDLRGYSNWQLTLMRNEIYARHGRPFQNSYIRSHFLKQSWYRPDANYRESRLSRLERENAEYIRDYQVMNFPVNGPATRP